MLRNTSAKKPAECFASHSTNGMITNAVSFEAPSGSASVMVLMVSGTEVSVDGSPAEVGMPEVKLPVLTVLPECSREFLVGFWVEVEFLLKRIPEVFHIREVAALVILKHAFEDIDI